jgi:hypothetical protein
VLLPASLPKLEFFQQAGVSPRTEGAPGERAQSSALSDKRPAVGLTHS